MRKYAVYVALAATLAMVWMSWTYLLTQPTGILIGKPAAANHWYRIALRIHVGGGLLALISGTVILLTATKSRYQLLHCRTGRFYTVVVCLSGTAGLLIAPYAIGGWSAAVGLAILDLLWLGSTVYTVVAARRKRISQHQLAATYSLALTFSAITLRLLLLLALTEWWTFVTVYRFATWASWLINIGAAAILLRVRNPALLALVLSFCTEHSVAQNEQRTVELRVHIERLGSSQGMIRACVTRDPGTFLETCYRDTAVVAAHGKVVLRMNDLPVARYAVSLYHDIDNNGRLNTGGLFGLPSEPYGFSRNPATWFGPPTFEQCSIHLDRDKRITVRMK